MTWLIFALVSCFCTCMAIEITRRHKFDGFEAQMYRSLISGFILLPFLPYMNFPSDLGFYLMIALSALGYSWGTVVMNNLATRKNGRVAMMYQPLAIFATFVLWLAINPTQITDLRANPDHLFVTIFCFVLLMGSLHFIRRNDYAWSALVTVAPVAISFAALNVAQKWFLGDAASGSGLGTILTILMLGNFCMFIVMPLLSRHRVASSELKITHMPVFPMIPLVIIALGHMIGWGTLMHAMQIADNPAYPVAILALSPAVFQAYYWIRGWKDNASPLAGATMTAGALILGFFNA